MGPYAANSERLLWVESGRSRMSIVAARSLGRGVGWLAIDQVNKSACSVTSFPKGSEGDEPGRIVIGRTPGWGA